MDFEFRLMKPTEIELVSDLVASIAEVTGPTSRHIFVNQCGYTSLKDVAYSDLPASVPFSRIKGADRCSLVIKILL